MTTANLILKPNRPKSVKRADIDAIPRIKSTDDDDDTTGSPISSSSLSKASAYSSFMQSSPQQTAPSLSSFGVNSERQARTNLFNSIKLGNAQLRSSAFDNNENTPVKNMQYLFSLCYLILITTPNI